MRKVNRNGVLQSLEATLDQLDDEDLRYIYMYSVSIKKVDDG